MNRGLTTVRVIAAVLVVFTLLIVGLATVCTSDVENEYVEQPGTKRIFHPGVFEDFVDDGDGAEGGTYMTLVDSDIPSYNDWCKGWKLKMLSGSNKGEDRDITGYHALTKTVTVGIPFSNPISTGDQYKIWLTDYDMMNIYYMCCQNMTGDVHYLDLTPHISNGDSETAGFPGLNKEDMNLTYTTINRMNFSYPRMGLAAEGKGMYCEYDDSITPFVNLTINTLGNLLTGEGGPGKELNMEIWFDTDGDYDIIQHTGDVEGIMGIDFNPDTDPIDFYTTVAPGWDTTQMEEYADGVGKWVKEPSAAEKDMQSGQIFVTIWRTDQVTDDDNNATADFIIYCGFAAKLSWLNLPYKHPLVNPVADAGIQIKVNGQPVPGPSQFAGFNDTLGQDPIRENEVVTFDATMSYDPQDDCGQDGLAFGDPGYPGPDPGEGDGIINDGVPEGEFDWGEVDRLQYRWFWLGSQDSGWLNSPYATHTFRLPSQTPYVIYEVKLMVRDPEMHTDTATCFLKVWADPGVPPTVTVSIAPDEDPTDRMATVLVDQEFQVTGYAVDPDPEQELSYYWDLNNFDPERSVEWVPGFHVEFLDPQDLNGTTEFTKKYSVPGYYRITLNVYDGPVGHIDTLNNTQYMIVHVVENTAPEGVVYAKILGSSSAEKEASIDVRNGQDVQFRVDAMDPDNLPGFDTGGDFVIDYNLQYRWDFGDGKTQDWTTDDILTHNYTSKGSSNNNYEYYTVSVKVRDGPEKDPNTAVTTLEPFNVHVNLLPMAEAGPDQPNLEVAEIQAGDTVYFNGSDSYDPNDDLDNSGVIDGDEVDMLSYSWTFDDKTKAASGKTVEHTFAKEGEYTVQLTVTDAGGRSASDSLRVVVVPTGEEPVVDDRSSVSLFSSEDATNTIINDEITVYTFDEITFDAGNCYDPDGEAYTDDKTATQPHEDLDFHWDFGDGSTTSTYYTVYSYSEDGEYKVTLSVTDNSHVRKETVTRTFTVHVLNRAPHSEIEGPENGWTNDLLLFDAEESWDQDGEVAEYRWEWGDELKDPWTTEHQAGHEYDKPGVYQAKLFVKDNDGEVSEVFVKNVTVTIEPPERDPSPIPKEVAVGGISILVILLLIGIIIAVFFVVKKLKS